MAQFTLFLTILITIITTSTSTIPCAPPLSPISCFNLPLPGGGKISFNSDTGVLRIRPPSNDKKNDFPPVPSVGTKPSQETLRSIDVRDTGTIRGFGSFATRALDRHVFLGFYEGEVIRTREALENRISERRQQQQLQNSRDDNNNSDDTSMDYVMSLDGGVTFLDGYERAMDKSTFSPVHLNHEDGGKDECNCIRLLEDDRVAFFTSRCIDAGEELRFDYGRNFWVGKEDTKI